MVEVFKTNVESVESADILIGYIQRLSAHYIVNFDLDDCDRILRVESHQREVDTGMVIYLLKSYGFDAEVLPDIIP